MPSKVTLCEMGSYIHLTNKQINQCLFSAFLHSCYKFIFNFATCKGDGEIIENLNLAINLPKSLREIILCCYLTKK